LDEILCGRFLVGLGIGVNTVLVPIYISEVNLICDSFSTVGLASERIVGFAFHMFG